MIKGITNLSKHLTKIEGYKVYNATFKKLIETIRPWQ